MMKVTRSSEGSLLVEILLYMTICSLMIGMVLLLHNEERREYHQFDREGRILFAHIKRMQLATLYGNLRQGSGSNQFLIEDHRYRYLDGDHGVVLRELPKSMHLESTGKTAVLTFGGHQGVGNAFTVTLVDDVIRYKRIFIFARQSGRIRWEEMKF